MSVDFMFFLNSVLLGIGLAMDAFSVSLANGLNEPQMKAKKMCGIAGVFSIFQGIMPMIGWVCIHSLIQYFRVFEKFIPWIALTLLGYIGGKMLLEGMRPQDSEKTSQNLTVSVLLIQGIATSIDALSVGFTIAEYNLFAALLASLIIAAVTFVICFAGLSLGKKAGTALAGRAGMLGGMILIAIGIEIFVSNLIS